jgi:hypothetical protein
MIEHTVTHWWNHGIGEIVTALLGSGLTLTGMAGHDPIPWRAFSGDTMTSAGGGEWRLSDRPSGSPPASRSRRSGGNSPRKRVRREAACRRLPKVSMARAEGARVAWRDVPPEVRVAVRRRRGGPAAGAAVARQ